MTERFNEAYNRLVELKTKLEVASEEEKGFIEEKIAEVEFELAYLEHIWLYE